METRVMEGKYIYCIIDAGSPKNFGPLGIGERGDELYTICFEDIAAVVSDSPNKKYPVSRENTLAHEKAIEEAMKQYQVLPVRFATIASDEKKVKKILEKEYGSFKDLLNKIRNKKELGLKAVFREDVIYKEILEKHEDIKQFKKAIASQPLEKTYYQRMEIGRMVERALEAEKETYKEMILGVLKPLAEDIKINNTYGERMIINTAFLVSKEKEPEFDQKVHQLDEEYGDRIKFKYVGTIPPFNFINLIIETGKY